MNKKIILMSTLIFSVLFSSNIIATKADAPVISNVVVSNITANSATVTWQSSSPDISYIMYGKENTPDGINYQVKDTAMVTDHKLVISPLAMNTKYYFQIESNSLTSNAIESSVYDFTTTSTIILSPNGGESWQAGKIYNILWQVDTNKILSTDRVDVKLVKDNLIVASMKNNTESYSATNGSLSWTIPSTLAPGSGYSITVEVCRYISANSCLSLGSDSSDSTFTIIGAVIPVIISDVKVGVVGGKFIQGGSDNYVDGSKVTISWKTNLPADSSVQDSLYQDFVGGGGITRNENEGYATSHTINLTLFSLNTNYYYKIISKTADGKEGSSTGSFTTSSAQLSPISNVRVTNITSNSAVVNWSTVEPDISYFQYGLVNSDDGINIEARNNNIVTAHVVILNNLQPGKIYYLIISANSQSDSAQNATTFSYRSGVYNFITLSSTSSEKLVTSVTKLGDGTYELNEGDKVKLDNGLMIVPVYFMSGSGSNEFHNVKFDVYLGATKLTTTDFTRVGWDTKTFKANAAFYDNFNMKYTFKIYVDELTTIGGAWRSKITFKSGDSVRKETGEIIMQKQETTKPVDQITQITANANLLSNDKMGEILAELKQLRNTVQEQQTQIKYLSSLLKNVNGVSAESQAVLNNFITYGVDANTQKLGAGERAAVVNSYKAAFDKLPQTEAELADVIKIANGRWPSITNKDAENQAKAQFLKIYKRAADMNGANDNAAVTIMAYGLRQKAENRNLNSEVNGIKIFKATYGHTPKTTEEWNAMQAITYSGATQKTWSGYNPNGN